MALRAVVAGALALGPGACANGGNVFSSAADPNDACGREHAAFADSKSFYLQEIGQGALFGALGGAALGALTAAATGGNAGQGALIGGGAGAVTGGLAGYFNARQQQAADQATLTNSIYSDINQASQQMDRATTTFANLRHCRFAEAERVKSAFRQGALGREPAVQALAGQKQRFDDELTLARQYGAKMADQDQQFRFASDSLISKDPQAQQIVATRAARLGPVVVPTTSTDVGGSYVATAPVNVRSAPSATASRVAGLAKGDTVRLAADQSGDEWRQIVLGDGTTGYVSTRFLAPAGSVVASAVPQARPPLNSDNRNAQVAVAATETIPEKRAVYSKAVDDAAQQSTLSFNLDQASPSA